MVQRLDTHPLLSLRTPLEKIDRRWLQMIEPDIFRPGPENEAFGCWLWQGAVNAQGEPIKRIPNPAKGKNARTTRILKKLVAEIYVIGWREDYSAFHECGNNNCLRPEHLLFTKLHHTQFDMKARVEKKRTSLKDYRNSVLRSAAKLV